MIRVLNLDGMFIPLAMPEVKYELFTFAGGELHIKLNNRIDYSQIDKVIITHRIRNSDDLMAILIAKDALELKGIKEIDLIIPYLPYARQDRKCYEGESFTLKVFSEVLTSAKFDQIIFVDVHSTKSLDLVKNSHNLSNQSFVEQVLFDFTTKPIIITPDAGAIDKSKILADNLNLQRVQCLKTRDPKTGDLSGFKVLCEDLKGKECLIVDDICDGGGTFLGLAKELKKKNAGDLYLFVTHGIFSKGLDELKKHFKTIYTTNSFGDTEGVVTYKIQL